jgi:hypothetical protein
MRSEPRITDEEAAELWRRAAELQIAAERAETASRAAPADEADGLSLAQVSAAAAGAGIDPEYVRLALAERRLPDAASIRRDLWTARWFRRLVHETDAIEATRAIPAPPARVLEAIRTVAADPSYHMTLEDALGDDPLADGVLVYRLGESNSSFHWDMNVTDARVLILAVRPHDGQTLLRVRVPLFRRGINFVLTGTLSGMGGAGGAFGGMALGGAIATALGVTAAVALAPAALGAVAGGVLGVAGYRKAYSWVLRQGDSALHRLLQAIALEAAAPMPAAPRLPMLAAEGEAASGTG